MGLVSQRRTPGCTSLHWQHAGCRGWRALHRHACSHAPGGLLLVPLIPAQQAELGAPLPIAALGRVQHIPLQHHLQRWAASLLA